MSFIAQDVPSYLDYLAPYFAGRNAAPASPASLASPASPVPPSLVSPASVPGLDVLVPQAILQAQNSEREYVRSILATQSKLMNDMTEQSFRATKEAIDRWSTYYMSVISPESPPPKINDSLSLPEPPEYLAPQQQQQQPDPSNSRVSEVLNNLPAEIYSQSLSPSVQNIENDGVVFELPSLPPVLTPSQVCAQSSDTHSQSAYNNNCQPNPLTAPLIEIGPDRPAFVDVVSGPPFLGLGPSVQQVPQTAVPVLDPPIKPGDVAVLSAADGAPRPGMGNPLVTLISSLPSVPIPGSDFASGIVHALGSSSSSDPGPAVSAASAVDSAGSAVDCDSDNCLPPLPPPETHEVSELTSDNASFASLPTPTAIPSPPKIISLQAEEVSLPAPAAPPSASPVQDAVWGAPALVGKAFGATLGNDVARTLGSNVLFGTNLLSNFGQNFRNGLETFFGPQLPAALPVISPAVEVVPPVAPSLPAIAVPAVKNRRRLSSVDDAPADQDTRRLTERFLSQVVEYRQVLALIKERETAMAAQRAMDESLSSSLARTEIRRPPPSSGISNGRSGPTPQVYRPLVVNRRRSLKETAPRSDDHLRYREMQNQNLLYQPTRSSASSFSSEPQVSKTEVAEWIDVLLHEVVAWASTSETETDAQVVGSLEDECLDTETLKAGPPLWLAPPNPSLTTTTTQAQAAILPNRKAISQAVSGEPMANENGGSLCQSESCSLPAGRMEEWLDWQNLEESKRLESVQPWIQLARDLEAQQKAGPEDYDVGRRSFAMAEENSSAPFPLNEHHKLPAIRDTLMREGLFGVTVGVASLTFGVLLFAAFMFAGKRGGRRSKRVEATIMPSMCLKTPGVSSPKSKVVPGMDEFEETIDRRGIRFDMSDFVVPEQRSSKH